jgi:CBS domain-containing protein
MLASLSPDHTAQDAAHVMEDREVGCVLVTERGRPVGIVTDRDLVLRALDRGLDAARTPLKDVMTSPVVCVRDDESPLSAGATMRERSVRRLPVLDADDRVLAMLTFDDLLRLLGRTHRELADMIAGFPVPFQAG